MSNYDDVDTRWTTGGMTAFANRVGLVVVAVEVAVEVASSYMPNNTSSCVVLLSFAKKNICC